jgi:hypothetical protein
MKKQRFTEAQGLQTGHERAVRPGTAPVRGV